MDSTMPSNVIIAKIRKNSISEVWVLVKEYKGKPSCDIREHFHPADSPEWLPTKKGVSIPTELVGQAVDAIEELAKKNTLCEVATIPRGERAKIRFAICEFRKHIYAEIRTYYRDNSENDLWKPGKGVTFRLDMIAQIAEALRLAKDYLD